MRVLVRVYATSPVATLYSFHEDPSCIVFDLVSSIQNNRKASFSNPDTRDRTSGWDDSLFAISNDGWTSISL